MELVGIRKDMENRREGNKKINLTSDGTQGRTKANINAVDYRMKEWEKFKKIHGGN